MKLYHCQFTRSGRARWMLEEIGKPYELQRVALMKGEHRTPEFQALNPYGGVPVFIDGELKLTESSAIVMHLADKFPEMKLAPPLGSDARAQYYRWMVLVPATIDPVLEAITLHTRILPEEMRVAAVAENAQKRVGSLLRSVDAEVGDKKFLVGGAFSGADVMMGSVAGWLSFLGILGEYPNLAAYGKALFARPAFEKSNAD
jgi:glutathione S-transferase